MFEKLIESAARKAFDATDVDKSGKLDMKELYICILVLYDYLNRWMPLQLQPPSMKKVRETMKKHDMDEDQQLGFDEFVPVAKALLFRPSSWQQSVVARFGWAMTVKFVLTPIVAGYVVKSLVNMSFKTAEQHPFFLTSVVDVLLRYTLLF